MLNVEQAIFTSAETDRAAGYHLVATSPGVGDMDARALAVWCPSHDSLLELGPDAASLNFHALPSGAFCVSYTTPAGWEYSGRGGHRVYTQCLVVPPEVLKRFANNPFSLFRAVQAGGMLKTHNRVPESLEPLLVAGRAAAVDQTLLRRLASKPGPANMAALVQAALDSVCLALTGPPSPAQLIAGLFSCLPLECRPEFPFSTGLKFSSRRPFRLVALSGDKTEKRWAAHQNNVTVLEVSDAPPAESTPIDGWSQFIKRVFATGRTSFLASQLSKQRLDLQCEDLPALGLQLLEDLDASTLHGDVKAGDGHPQQPSHAVRPLRPGTGLEDLEHTHPAHSQFEKSGQLTVTARVREAAPSRKLQPASPAVMEKLERLDDLVYDAIGGQTTALDQLKTLWPALLDGLSEEWIAESREQYLRYALTIWEQCVDGTAIRQPARAVQALDVLCLLFNNA